jgi:hypothetical protein
MQNDKPATATMPKELPERSETSADSPGLIQEISRRELLIRGGKVAAVAAVSSVFSPFNINVKAAREPDRIQDPQPDPPDTCLYMEAVPGDAGAHSAAGQWWLSDDVKITGPDTMGRATPGPNQNTPLANTIQVRVHKKDGCQVSSNVVLVDVYAGDPALAMTPSFGVAKLTNAANRPNATIDLTTTTVGPSGTVLPITWNLPLFTSGPESPGHKCLIARIYPDSETPSSATFNLPLDQHVVQHNICIIPCGSPCGQQVQTTNLNRGKSERVVIRAVADLEPSERVLRAIRPRLEAALSFKRLNTNESPPFRLEFAKTPNLQTINSTGKPSSPGKYGRLKTPNFEAHLKLKAAQTAKFRFTTDLGRAKVGDAFVYHLTHIGANGSVQGGLTIAAVRTQLGKW